jgi:RNA polymerase sigma-70 factor, ECF subfamily
MLKGETILLQRFASNGDAEAFSEIVRLNAGLVYGVCVRILANKDQAADVTQETFFQLLRNAESITGSVSNWLHGVATNKAVDMIRRDSSRRRREAKYVMGKQAQTEKWEDISGYVDEAMDELDEQTREILVQHFLKGVKMTEIGEEFGLSQPTVSRRVKAGVSELRNKLQKRGVIVAVITLSTLLGEQAVAAAPTAVLKELGKMAIVGGAATVGTGAGVKAAASAAAMGVKAKIVTAVAVAAIGTGAVVTYQQTTKPAQQSQPGGTRVLSRQSIGENRKIEQQSKKKAAVGKVGGDYGESKIVPGDIVGNAADAKVAPKGQGDQSRGLTVDETMAALGLSGGRVPQPTQADPNEVDDNSDDETTTSETRSRGARGGMRRRRRSSRGGG